MSDFSVDYETLENLVTWRLDQLVKDDAAKQREAELQTISVRLRPGDVAIIDHMAKQLDWTRQQFLSRVIDTSLLQLMAAFSKQEQEPDQRSDAYRKLMDIRYGAVSDDLASTSEAATPARRDSSTVPSNGVPGEANP